MERIPERIIIFREIALGSSLIKSVKKFGERQAKRLYVV
jgi:hypothetical protein